jgi:hypothetical protein
MFKKRLALIEEGTMVIVEDVLPKSQRSSLCSAGVSGLLGGAEIPNLCDISPHNCTRR